LLRLLPFSHSNLPLPSSVVIGSHGAEETPPPRQLIWTLRAEPCRSAPVCERGANQFNLAKIDYTPDNVKPLGMKAKSNQKNLVKTGIRNLSLISTI